MVVHLAQLKGLMDSRTATPGREQAALNQPLLSLSPEEVFSLLDLNQDGFLQKQEVFSGQRHTNIPARCKRKTNFQNRFYECTVWLFFVFGEKTKIFCFPSRL